MALSSLDIAAPLLNAWVTLEGRASEGNYLTATGGRTLTVDAGVTTPYSLGGTPSVAGPYAVGVAKGDVIVLGGGGGSDDGKILRVLEAPAGESYVTVDKDLTVEATQYPFEIVRKVARNARPFTRHGKSFLAAIVAWSSIGDVDAPVLSERIRYFGVGSGNIASPEAAKSLAAPVILTGTSYLDELTSVVQEYNCLVLDYRASEFKNYLLSEMGIFSGESAVSIQGSEASILNHQSGVHALVTGLSGLHKYHESKYLYVTSASYAGMHKIVEVLDSYSAIIEGLWTANDGGNPDIDWHIATPEDLAESGPLLYVGMSPLAVLDTFKLSTRLILD